MIKSKSRIKIPAISYQTGDSNKSEHSFGQGIIVDGGEAKSDLTWYFDCKQEGEYYLISRYASRDKRPVSIYLNNHLIKEKGLAEVTGGWNLAYLKKFNEGIFELSKGLNQLRIKCDNFIPHIHSLEWTQSSDIKKELKPDLKEKITKSLILNPYRSVAPNLSQKFLSVWAQQGMKTALLKTRNFLNPLNFIRSHYADVLGVYSKNWSFVGPRLIQLDITNQCNNDCVGCWCHSPLLEDQQMPLSQRRMYLPFNTCIEVLEELASMGCREIYFAGGGDPSTHPQFMEVIEKTKELGFIAYINTNFTLFDNSKIENLVRIGVDHFTLSVWAGSEKSYLATHPNKKNGDFLKLKESISYLNRIKRGPPYTKVYHVISSHNFWDFENMVKFATDTGSDSVEFTMVDIVQGKTDSLLLNDEQLAELRKNAYDLNEKLDNGFLENVKMFRYREFLRRISDSENVVTGNYDRNIIDGLPCTIGWTFSRVNADGEINGCLKSHRIPLGNLSESPFSKIWNSPKQNWFRQHSLDMKKGDPFFKMIGNDPTSEMGCYKSCDDIGRNEFMAEKISKTPILVKGILKGVVWLTKHNNWLKKALTVRPHQTRKDIKDPEIKGFQNGRYAYTGPREVVIDLTNFCKSSCSPCFTKSPLLKKNKPTPDWFKRELDWNVLIRFLNSIKKMGTRSIRLSGGGDPLFFPQIIQLVDAIHELGISLSITTNLYGVEPRILDQLQTKPIDELTISLMSASPETYMQTHPYTNENSFDELIKQTRNFVKNSSIKVVLSHVISNKNYRDVFKMAQLSSQLNVSGYYFCLVDAVHPELKELLLSKSQALEVLHSCRRIEKNIFDGVFSSPFHLDSFIRRLKSQISVNKSSGKYEEASMDKIPCSIGWHFTRILANGQVSGCCKGAHYSLGNINEKDFEDIWNDNIYQDFRYKTKNWSKKEDFFRQFGCLQSCDNYNHNMEFYQEKVISP